MDLHDETRLSPRERIRGWWEFTVKYEARKRSERALNALARRLPRRLRYAVWITTTADASTDPELGSVPVPDQTLNDLLHVTHRQLAS